MRARLTGTPPLNDDPYVDGDYKGSAVARDLLTIPQMHAVRDLQRSGVALSKQVICSAVYPGTDAACYDADCVRLFNWGRRKPESGRYFDLQAWLDGWVNAVVEALREFEVICELHGKRR